MSSSEQEQRAGLGPAPHAELVAHVQQQRAKAEQRMAEEQAEQDSRWHAAQRAEQQLAAARAEVAETRCPELVAVHHPHHCPTWEDPEGCRCQTACGGCIGPCGYCLPHCRCSALPWS